MNPDTTSQLAALRRVVTAVRRFRADPHNTKQGAYPPALAPYLHQHLSPADWALWQSLQLDWQHSKEALSTVGL